MDDQNEAAQTEAGVYAVQARLRSALNARGLGGYQASAEEIAAQQARDDAYTRQTALQQACHDLKGMSDAKETVERARAYFLFLKNG